VVGGAVSDALKSKPELIAENALLRQQLIILKRQVKQVKLKGHERLLLVLLASKVRARQQAVLLVKPETLLGWHRRLFRLLWKHKTATASRRARVPAETIAQIRQMARENHLWGAERIQSELRQVGIKLAKRTIQRYMRAVRSSRPHGQT
jgi:putative transposase